jgi:WD40 repeat protein
LLLKSNWQDTRINNRNETQTIEVRVKPIIPTFFVILLILLISIPTWYLSPLNPTNPFPPHLSAVTSVQFEGSGTRAISSSNDRTMRKWFVDGFDKFWINQDIGVIAETNKAIRIARFRPVNNDMMAAGLENGEIQIWNYSNGNDQILAKFSASADDRVFGLEYTLDSRSLFSGHGSGTVLRWDLQNLLTVPPTQPSQSKKFDFSITSIALVGEDDTTLAIAGRYNQLVLWNWVNDTIKKVPYPKNGGQDDYIQSIAVAARKRNLLAATDNQGYMSVWDLSACLKSDRACQMLDGWENGHHGKPVLASALSEQGCYLLSGGDDGEVKLWALTGNGKRVGGLLNGTTLEVRPSAVTGVDIHLDGDNILTVVGTRAGRVVGHKVERMYKLGCDTKK